MQSNAISTSDGRYTASLRNFFFQAPSDEGNRHLLAAKRMAFDLGLYLVI